MEIQAVFLDRDGTIGGSGHFIHPDEFKPYENFYDEINKLKERGRGSLGEYRYLWEDVEPDYIAEDVSDAITWLINKYY